LLSEGKYTMQIKAWKYAVIAAVFGLFLGAWTGFGTTKGIDLAGGSVLIYQLDGKNVNAEMTQSTASILQRRLDTLGLKEMAIRPAGTDKVMIELPGVTPDEVKRTKNVIESSGRMFFKIVYKKTIGAQRTDPDTDSLIREIQAEKLKDAYDASLNDYDTAMYQPTNDDGTNSGPAYPVLLINEDTVDGKLLAGAQKSQRASLKPTVDFWMKPEGRARLAKTTTRHQNSQMAIVLDGLIISAPNINNPITGGSGIIEGTFTADQIKELTTVLRSGALPAKPILQSEDTVAPTLGADSIRRGMIAIGLAIALTLAFMIFYYRLAGVIADFALVLNIVILFGVMSLFEAVLTLPGIAGIVLTMGMAVDANILINERIREEFNRGVPINEAVKAGYGNAFSAILDSNITTILTAAILYAVGTGPIKGFAITLAVGIGASLFTALWVTRVLFDLVLAKGWYTKVNYLQLLSSPNIPFIAKRKPFVIAAIILANVGFLLFSGRSAEKYGIDFNGGSAVQIRLREDGRLNQKTAEERIQTIEVTSAGKTTKPYADATVTRLGENDASGNASSFQIMLNRHGQVDTMITTAKAEGAPEEEEAKTITPQEQFERDIAEVFKAELLPESFEMRPAVEDQVDGKAVKRMSLIARFDENAAAQEEGGVTAASLAAALEAGEDFAKGATVKVLDEGIPAGLSFEVTSANQPFDVGSEKIETQLRNAIVRKHRLALSNPFPFKTSIGSAVAEELKGRGILAIMLSMIMMIIYIAFRFEFKAGVAAVICLFHDVFTALGFMMLFDMMGLDAKIDLTTIAAFLTIVGYSINDTIVTLDRMRENLQKKKIKRGDSAYEQTLNDSINQVLSRTILTSATVLIVLIVLAAAGVHSLQGFTLALIVGAIVGTFSSIYVATPIILSEPKKIIRLVLIELALIVVVTVAGGFLIG
jgi:SecD/SecF fusion protein